MCDAAREPNLSQMLEDPLMHALMRSDGVEPSALRHLLSEAWQRIAGAEDAASRRSPRTRS